MTRWLALAALAVSFVVSPLAAAASGPVQPATTVAAEPAGEDAPCGEAERDPVSAEDLDDDHLALPRRLSYLPPSPDAVHERRLPADPLNHRLQPVEPPPNRASRP